MAAVQVVAVLLLLDAVCLAQVAERKCTATVVPQVDVTAAEADLSSLVEPEQAQQAVLA